MSGSKPKKRPHSETRNKHETTPEATVEALKHAHICPITQSLFVDPVVAADGNTYERTAIEKWLAAHSTSPLNNEELPSKTVYPSITVRQAVTGIISAGSLAGIDNAAAAAWHVASGQKKHTGQLPGGQEAAKAHFKTAAELGSEEAKIVMSGMSAYSNAKKANIDLSWLFSQHTGSHHNSNDWVALPSYLQLPPGTMMLVMSDVAGLERMCERPAPDCELSVDWCPEMDRFAGQEAIMIAHETETAAYNLVLPEDREEDGLEAFQFPHDTLKVRRSVLDSLGT